MTTFFQRSELFHTLIKRTQAWLKSGADGYAKNPRYEGKFPNEMPKEAYEKIWKIWRGTVWRVCVKITYENESGEIVEDIDREKSYFAYSRPENVLPDEKIVKVPALQHMNPISQTKDRTELGIRIREYTDFATAWFGMDYALLNLDARFHYNFTDEQRPFFESDEQILELHSQTDYVGRDYFNIVIDILIEEWEKYETELFLFLQSLIKLTKGNQNEEDEHEEPELASSFQS